MRKDLIMGKNLMKWLFVVIATFMLIITPIGIMALGEEETPPTEEELPSDLALWIEDNIIEIVVGVASGTSLISGGLAFVITWLKKKTKQMNEERQLTNQAQISQTEQVRLLENYIKSVVVTAISEYTKKLDLTQEQLTSIISGVDTFTKNVEMQIKVLENEQYKTIEMLRLAFINDKELVRAGVVETINRIADGLKEPFQETNTPKVEM
jgi:hypothetical protein